MDSAARRLGIWLLVIATTVAAMPCAQAFAAPRVPAVAATTPGAHDCCAPGARHDPRRSVPAAPVLCCHANLTGEPMPGPALAGAPYAAVMLVAAAPPRPVAALGVVAARLDATALPSIPILLRTQVLLV